MKFPWCSLGLLIAAAWAGLSCASVTKDSPSASGGTTGRTGSGGGTSMTGGGGSGGVSGIVEADGGHLISPDVPVVCAQLNIGILGNPGSNDSSNFQMWLEARGTTVQRIQTTPDVPLTAEALKAFDVVVLDLPPRDYTADEAAIFGAWVSAGGGVASMSGYHNDTTQDWRANSLLSQLGLAYSGQLVWGPVTQFAAHPITAGLTSVTFTGGYAITDLGGGASTRTPIAFVPANGDQVAVGYAVQMGTGRAFVWGDEWIEFDSEWSAQPQIPALWLQVFSWIAPANHCTLTGIG